MDHRKIIKFGNSSHVISLPKTWLTKHNLNKGDTIYFIENSNNELIIFPELKESKREQKVIVIDTTDKNEDRIRREIYSGYLNHYDTIKIVGKDLKQKDKKIKNIIHNLMALEIIEQTGDKILTRDFLKITEISILDIIRKMDITLRSIMSDIKLTLKEDNYESILNREDNINKLWFLIIRVVRAGLSDPSYLRSIKATYPQLFRYWHTGYHIERISDYIKRLIKPLTKIKNHKKTVEELLKVFSNIEETYATTMAAFYKKDLDLAYTLSNKKKEIGGECNTIYGKNWNLKHLPIITENFKNIIASNHKILRLIYS